MAKRDIADVGVSIFQNNFQHCLAFDADLTSLNDIEIKNSASKIFYLMILDHEKNIIQLAQQFSNADNAHDLVMRVLQDKYVPENVYKGCKFYICGIDIDMTFKYKENIRRFAELVYKYNNGANLSNDSIIVFLKDRFTYINTLMAFLYTFLFLQIMTKYGYPLSVIQNPAESAGMTFAIFLSLFSILPVVAGIVTYLVGTVVFTFRLGFLHNFITIIYEKSERKIHRKVLGSIFIIILTPIAICPWICQIDEKLGFIEMMIRLLLTMFIIGAIFIVAYQGSKNNSTDESEFLANIVLVKTKTQSKLREIFTNKLVKGTLYTVIIIMLSYPIFYTSKIFFWPKQIFGEMRFVSQILERAYLSISGWPKVGTAQNGHLVLAYGTDGKMVSAYDMNNTNTENMKKSLVKMEHSKDEHEREIYFSICKNTDYIDGVTNLMYYSTYIKPMNIQLIRSDEVNITNTDASEQFANIVNGICAKDINKTSAKASPTRVK